jgi:tRNA-specific 2-thiouridylase
MSSEAAEKIVSSSMTGRSIVVAMSGGVDSSVAAYLLSKTDAQLVGVSMQVWDYKKSCSDNSKATCCSPADFNDARRVAAKLDMPYYVVDFEAYFEKEVINRFVETYQLGMTPNPCIDCNSRVKFRELRERALSFGCSHVATGHYARIRESADGFHLLRGVDRDKDQSYFLYTCRQDELGKTLFPIGDYTKPEIREIAREVGLVTADKPESQDICFVAGSVQDFVAKIGGRRQKGDFVLKDGTKIGEHEGIHRFTVGQRKGLNIGGLAEPLYVVDLDPATHRVILGSREDLKRESFTVREMHWVNPQLIKRIGAGESGFELDVIVQVRSRHHGVRARMKVLDKDTCVFTWHDEWAAISPGQAAVVYDLQNEELLAGGRIAK